MSVPRTFAEYIGNAGVVEIVRRAVLQDRLPHAMVFAGPAGTGKRTLALLLARLLNCGASERERPCGFCAACRKILSGNHPDVRVIEPDGAFIKVDQVREMINEVAYQPFEGRYRVVILDGADQLQAAGANSLLKTLEEPPSRTFIILVTPRPYLLLTTIRSRARTLQFGGIPPEQVEQYLVRHAGKSRDEARLATLFSRGSLGAALAFDSGDYREARGQAVRFARLLLGHGSFTQVSALVAEIAKEKDRFQVWLEALALVLQDTYYTHVAPQRVAQPDIEAELTALATASTRRSVVSALRALQRLRQQLQNNVRREIALEALFLAEMHGARLHAH